MNNIELSKNYVPLLDELYNKEETSSVLNSGEDTIKNGANAGEFLVAKYTIDGPADYSRNGGYQDGDVSVEWETHKANYDRGRKFSVDTMDNEETEEIAFGKVAAQYAKTKSAPERDAFTYATLAGYDGVNGTPETLTSGDDVLNALIREQNAMDEEEVASTRILFITPTKLRQAKNVEKYKSTGVLDEFDEIVEVPQRRFYTAIDLLDGSSSGEKAGGYRKHIADSEKVGDVDGKNINFMIVEKSAVIKFDKHTASDIIVPENNPDADSYIQKFRKYGITDVYENKVAGIRYSYVN
mgnify:CR=1 FL=1